MSDEVFPLTICQPVADRAPGWHVAWLCANRSEPVFGSVQMGIDYPDVVRLFANRGGKYPSGNAATRNDCPVGARVICGGRGFFDRNLAGSLPRTIGRKNIMVEVELQNISKNYARKKVLKKVDLKFEKGRFSVVFGSPVTGKSVLMRLIMGLESADSGSIFLRGREVTHLAAGVRNFGYVPQSFALYPHYRVYENIAYPLTLARKNKETIRQRVEPLAKKLRIEALLDKYPSQLSGGEKQRGA